MTKYCKNTLNVGDVLNNKWVVLEFIGKGGMGEVYRAHQTNLKRDVAIKVISREWLESLENGDEEAETIPQRFRREGQAKSSSSLPSVISRLPWEGFEEVGFRTVLNPSNKNQ
jgi:serine/threonine protein kinase